MSAYVIAQALYAAGFAPPHGPGDLLQVGVQFVGRVNLPKGACFPLTRPTFSALGEAPLPIECINASGTMEVQLKLASLALVDGLRVRGLRLAGAPGLPLPERYFVEAENSVFAGIHVRWLTHYRVAQDCLITQVEVLAR